MDRELDDRAEQSAFAKRAFFPRAIGLAAGFFCVAGVFLERQTPFWLWLPLLLFCFVWPWLALLIALRVRQPVRVEKRNVLFDSLLGAFWIAAIGFNVLPSVVMLSMLVMNNIATGGLAFVLRGWMMQVLGGLVAVLLLGFEFSPQTSQMQIYFCLPMVVIHPLTIGLVLYHLALQLGRNRRALSRLSRTDALTGLYNRGHWNALLRQAFEHCRRSSEPASLALIDLDLFKAINDRHGHVVGDEVLTRVAGCLREHLRREDLPGRFGGDEFCVLLPGVDAEQAAAVLERIRSEVLSLRFASQQALGVSLSIGVAGFDSAMRDPVDWLREADRALYEAKRLGRDRLVLALPQQRLQPWQVSVASA